MGVSIIDYLTLAKAGYKKADIDQIIALSKQEEAEKPEEPQAATLNNDNVEKASADPEGEPENEASTEEPVKEVIDYKSLYEKSQEDLKTAQAANRKRDNSDAHTYGKKDLQDAIRSFL